VLCLAGAVFSDFFSMLPKEHAAWLNRPDINLFGILLFFIFLSLIGLPKLIIWWWQCRPLPDDDFKNRLLVLMKKSGVKARGILVWGPRESGLLNACVLGPWASYRYVLISPQLLDELGQEETEAVLAHELGHARYGHLTLLLIMLLLMSVAFELLLRAFPIASPLTQTGMSVCFIILYVWGFFGSVLRQCEREADLASAEMMGSPRPLIAALEKLALINGNTRKIYSWHHGSIAQRVASVEQLNADPVASRSFHAKLRWMRIFFITLTGVAIGVQVFLHY
ncbi:MAG: M48 family metallopeptidase, partial [Planctomycetota bacterium]